VTRSYPKLVATDAAFWLKAFKSGASSHYQDSVGVIAAWAAVTINFLLPQLIPGNPVEVLISRMSQSGTIPADEDQVLTRLLGRPSFRSDRVLVWRR